MPPNEGGEETKEQILVALTGQVSGDALIERVGGGRGGKFAHAPQFLYSRIASLLGKPT